LHDALPIYKSATAPALQLLFPLHRFLFRIHLFGVHDLPGTKVFGPSVAQLIMKYGRPPRMRGITIIELIIAGRMKSVNRKHHLSTYLKKKKPLPVFRKPPLVVAGGGFEPPSAGRRIRARGATSFH